MLRGFPTNKYAKHKQYGALMTDLNWEYICINRKLAIVIAAPTHRKVINF